MAYLVYAPLLKHIPMETIETKHTYQTPEIEVIELPATPQLLAQSKLYKGSEDGWMDGN